MSSNRTALESAWQEFHAGRLDSAEAAALQIVAEQSSNADGFHLLGLIAHRLNRDLLALEYIGTAIRLNSSASQYHNSMGEANRALGKLDAAKGEYATAISLEPRNASALNNLGIVHYIEGKYELATGYLKQAIGLNPSLAEAHDNLGAVRLAQCLHDEAISAFQHALALQPGSSKIRVNLAIALRMQGRKLDAIKILLDGLAVNPEESRLRLGLADTLDGYPLANATKPVRELLEDLCRDESISTQSLAHAVIGLVKHAAGFGMMRNAVASGVDILASTASGVPLAATLMSDPLLLAAMPRIVINDPELERVLTQLRRGLLMRLDSEAQAASVNGAVPINFLCAFARQCFNTEYAYYQPDDESERLEKLKRDLDSLLLGSHRPSLRIEWLLLHWTLYAPLHWLRHWERLVPWPSEHWSTPFCPIWEDQIDTRRREREIASDIKAITPISDSVSQAVREQYEESPYPRWFGIHRVEPASTQNPAIAVPFGTSNEPRRPPNSILVAGCGTGQHPLSLARKYPTCGILATDLSRASLAYAKRMAERLSIFNVTFAQADILEMGSIARSFEHIECSGVLHHMKDPLAGWRVLAGLLEQAGTMKIALYSETARRTLADKRALVTERGFPATPEGIRGLRKIILEMSSESSPQSVLNSLDFYSLSGCRDLLMHVQEHQFTLPRIRQCLDELGMRFLGFNCSAELQGRFRARYPTPGAASDLELWNDFEAANPDAFRGMYQFTCEKLPNSATGSRLPA